MQLFPAMAQKIVQEVSAVMTEQIIVVDNTGTIIASSDKNRIGNYHEGAMQSLKERQTIYIDHERARLFKDVKPGINMPLYFDKNPIGVIGITGKPETVKPFAELLRRMIELLVAESYHSEQLQWVARGLESFVFEWVNLDTVETDFIERGEILGIKMTTPYLVMMLQIDHLKSINTDHQLLEREMMEWFYRHFPKNNADFLVSWGQGRFVLLKSVDTVVERTFLTTQLLQWKNYFQTTFSVLLCIGVGKTVQTKIIGKCYLEAKKALKAAEKNHAIVFYEDLLFELLLQDMPNDSKNAFLSKTLQPIIDDAELMDTIKVYLSENQSIKRTAERMHIHINTLHYRLRQIKEKTNIDPKNTEGIVLFYLALAFHRGDV